MGRAIKIGLMTQNAPVDLMEKFLRAFAVTSLTLAFAYTLNNFLIHIGGFKPLFHAGAWVIAIYTAAFSLSGGLFFATLNQDLHQLSKRFSSINIYLVRGAFWAVFLVGIGDTVISFLRVEQLAEPVLGEAMAQNLNKQSFRGAYIHIPLIVLGFAFAAVMRGLGFIWLTILVVFAQLSIVITVNVYSYEQAFQGDLVRFWYAALFLFAAPYTLLKGGHVRIDVVFAELSEQKKRAVNFWGALILGMPLAWVILLIGTWDQSRAINSPILRYEIGQQSASGLYIKYLMAGFLLVLAITLIIEFCALMLSNIERNTAKNYSHQGHRR